jgi:hypothetical protein
VSVSKTVFRLKHGKEVARALKEKGFHVRRVRPRSSIRLFEEIVADKLVNVRNRDVVIWVEYRFDDSKTKEICDVYASSTGIVKRLEDEVTPEAVLRAVGDVKRAVSKALARVDAIAEANPLKAEGLATATRNDQYFVHLGAQVLGKERDHAGVLEFTIDTKSAYVTFHLTIPAREYRKALNITRKIARMVKRAGFQLRP